MGNSISLFSRSFVVRMGEIDYSIKLLSSAGQGYYSPEEQTLFLQPDDNGEVHVDRVAAIVYEACASSFEDFNVVDALLESCISKLTDWDIPLAVSFLPHSPIVRETLRMLDLISVMRSSLEADAWLYSTVVVERFTHLPVAAYAQGVGIEIFDKLRQAHSATWRSEF